MRKRISLETRRRRGKRGGKRGGNMEDTEDVWYDVSLGPLTPYNSNNDWRAHTPRNPFTTSIKEQEDEDAVVSQINKKRNLRKLLEGKTIWVLLFVIIMFIIGIVVYNTV